MGRAQTLRLHCIGPRNTSRASGFTLLELLIVITIAALLLLITTPALSGFVLDSRRSAAINEFIVAIQRSRAEAISTHRTISLCAATFDRSGKPICSSSGGWEAGWIVFDDRDGDGTLDIDESLLLHHGALGYSASLRGNSKVARRMIFKPSGITANNGRLVYCDRRGWTDDARIVSVSVGGRIRTVSKSKDPNPPLAGCMP